MNKDAMILHVKAGRSAGKYWRDLCRFRELLFFLAWRDIAVRYRQTYVGVAWAMLRPFVTMIVLTIVFGKIANMSSGGVAYPILVFAAMLPWQFFASGLVDCGNSLITNTELVSKVYFPRLIIPFSSLLVNLVDLIFSGLIMVGLMIWFHAVPDWRIAFLPLFLILGVMTTLGIGLWVAALNVEYRDFRHLIPFIVQFGLYISPVGFSSEVIPAKWRIVYALNPMVGVIDGFRWSLLAGHAELNQLAFILSLCVSSLLFVSGVWVFRKKESEFADVI